MFTTVGDQVGHYTSYNSLRSLHIESDLYTEISEYIYKKGKTVMPVALIPKRPQECYTKLRTPKVPNRAKSRALT